MNLLHKVAITLALLLYIVTFAASIYSGELLNYPEIPESWIK